ncbi:MAG: ABC transporter permease [Dehalococcoidia bacterium]|nr:ABC transporter permease [Dehalococcoidia bacterium]
MRPLDRRTVQDDRPIRHRPIVSFFTRLAKEKPLGLLGGLIVLLMLLSGIFAEFLAQHEMDEINLIDRLVGTTINYPLGTDHLGRDILSRMIYGARVSMTVGMAASTLAVAVAVIIAVPSGYFSGKYDIVLQRLVDGFMSFPSLIVLLTVMSIVGRGLPQIILVLGVVHGIGTSRVIRGAVIGIKENDYFTASEAVGNTTLRTLMLYIMPNVMAPTIIVFTTSIGAMILWEASLSFLGFGLPPEAASWGGMLSTEGRTYMEMKPALALWPGLAITAVVYGINMFGDAMRDLLDPRLRGSR